MATLMTVAQMRSNETAAIASGDVTGLDLMERAGRGVVNAIFETWPDLAATSHRAVVLCGPGNNGGDGFVVARLLKEWGWQVEVFFLGNAEKLPPDARVNHRRWAAMGQVVPYTDAGFELDPQVWDTDTLLVDALFGTGLSRPVSGCSQVARISQSSEWRLHPDLRTKASPGCRCVAIDVPSGLDADSGRFLGDETVGQNRLTADLTVTFHCAKLGHYLAEGPQHCGKLVVKDIGLAETAAGRRDFTGVGEAVGHGTDAVKAVTAPPLRAGFGKSGTGHKYTHGHALVLSGPMGRSGAARLAARAALRVGAGLVTVAAPGSAMMECATQLTAIMLRKCNDADDLAALLGDKRLGALCLGPGLGVGEGTRALVVAALADRDRAVVLDADALTAFAARPEDLFQCLHSKVVLTPHAGEFARLFPDIATRFDAPATGGPAYSKVDATRAAAARTGCAVLFKGPDTVISAPSGTCSISAAAYESAAPWLATAGSGDVLAGLIVGLLARGLCPMQAAEAAAHIHLEAALAFGPGLIAEDLPEMVPQVFHQMGL